MQEAVDFLKREVAGVAQLLSKTHHNVIGKFIEFKGRYERMMAERDTILKNWQIAEILLAQKSPVFEAEYAIEPRTPLRLYDCLVPTLKEHRRFTLKKFEKFSVEDMVAKKTAQQLDWQLAQMRQPALIKENDMLKGRVATLENECSVVKWYLEAMEGGLDTHLVVKEYTLLKKDHKTLQKTSKKTIAQLEREVQ